MHCSYIVCFSVAAASVAANNGCSDVDDGLAFQPNLEAQMGWGKSGSETFEARTGY